MVILVTVGTKKEGDELAAALVGECLAACVNVIGPITSIYRWQGDLRRDEEFLLLIKTTAERYEELESRVSELHSYDVPEIIALAIERGSAPYLDWLAEQTR
jgi:periplasmic divalent cation tolerance protein